MGGKDNFNVIEKYKSEDMKRVIQCVTEIVDIQIAKEFMKNVE
jgi:hypothetical protein